MPGDALKIRDFHNQDFETLFDLDQICFANGIAFSRGELAFHLTRAGSIARVAGPDNLIAGFALAGIEKKGVAHIITLDIAPAWRRQGVATLLMEDLHGQFERRNVRISILEVGTNNTSAQALYTKLGYSATEKLVGYYRGIDDAYRMERLIKL